MDWTLKDFSMMSRNEIEHFYHIAESTGAKNVRWSGLVKKEDKNANNNEKLAN